jgi:hypothetical protein
MRFSHCRLDSGDGESQSGLCFLQSAGRQRRKLTAEAKAKASTQGLSKVNQALLGITWPLTGSHGGGVETRLSLHAQAHPHPHWQSRTGEPLRALEWAACDLLCWTQNPQPSGERLPALHAIRSAHNIPDMTCSHFSPQGKPQSLPNWTFLFFIEADPNKTRVAEYDKKEKKRDQRNLK